MVFRDLAARMDNAIKAHVATDVAVIGGNNVQGAFSKEYVETTQIQGHRPIFRCMVADLGAAGLNSTLVYDGTTYTIKVLQPDGTGWTAMILQEA